MSRRLAGEEPEIIVQVIPRANSHRNSAEKKKAAFDLMHMRKTTADAAGRGAGGAEPDTNAGGGADGDEPDTEKVTIP